MSNNISIKYFLLKLMEYINENNDNFKVYYEEAEFNANFPYGVIPTFTYSPLNYGIQGVFDVEIYTDKTENNDAENICDLLRKKLDGFNYIDNNIAFHTYYDSQLLSKQTEQDMTYRRVTFIARIF